MTSTWIAPDRLICSLGFLERLSTGPLGALVLGSGLRALGGLAHSPDP